MFLTMPLTVAPSWNEASRCSRSAPAVSSSTARRETTTLLRLRSSLMTLKSISLPSYGVVSFTGRRSTSEPGRNARMPFVMTVRPPFTLPVMTPFTLSAGSRAFHSTSPAPLLDLEPRRQALRLVTRQPRRAESVFQRLDRDADEIARLDVHLAGVVAELLRRDDAFRLQARVHHHPVVVDGQHLGGDHLADAHLLAIQALLEQGGE